MLGFSSFHLAYCETESHRRSSSSASSYSLRKFIPLWPVRYILNIQTLCFLQLADCCFLELWFVFVNFFLTFFKTSTNYGYFPYVSYGIFPHWFSLNQLLKFSVSFATEVEKKNRPSRGCFNRGLQSTKDLKRATVHLSPPRNNVRDLKSQLLSGKTWLYPCSFKCLKSVADMACGGLPPFFVLHFLLKRSLLYVACLVSLAHFPWFCWHYFSLSTAFSIHLARKTYFLLCSGLWDIFLTFLLLFCVQNQIVVCWKPWPVPYILLLKQL